MNKTLIKSGSDQDTAINTRILSMAFTNTNTKNKQKTNTKKRTEYKPKIKRLLLKSDL